MNDDRLRIGDAERDQAAAALGEHVAQGRLSPDEHTDRLDRIWAARTRADLTPVFADLPGPYAARSAEPARPGPTRPDAAAPAPRPPYASVHRGPWPFGRGYRTGLVALLVVLAAVLVVTHLPVILVGLLVLWLLTHRRHHRPGWRRGPAWRY